MSRLADLCRARTPSYGWQAIGTGSGLMPYNFSIGSRGPHNLSTSGRWARRRTAALHLDILLPRKGREDLRFDANARALVAAGRDWNIEGAGTDPALRLYIQMPVLAR